MPTDQQRAEFLRDVSDAMGRWAFVTGGPVAWDSTLEALAQQSALARYGEYEAPVWCKDGELTAAHLARRKATMDSWDYRNIIHELGRQMVAERAARPLRSGSGLLRAAESDSLAESSLESCDVASEASSLCSSRSASESELSEVFETVDEQLVTTEAVDLAVSDGSAEAAFCAVASYSLADLRKLGSNGSLAHLNVDESLVSALDGLARDEAMAFLGLDTETETER